MTLGARKPMRTIAHVSDLHFGRVDEDVAAGLLEELRRRSPDLVVVSGDLTQRARRREFRAAREYLDRIPVPRVVVPGNHDVPLFDIARRFLAPLDRYRRYIDPEPNGSWEDDRLLVVGINTARSLTWKNGRVSEEQMRDIARAFRPGDERFKIAVTHHPFIPPPTGRPSALVGRARRVVPVLRGCGVDLLLAGHLHVGYTGNIAHHYLDSAHSILVAHAGTAISRRVRSEPNSYNWITVDPPHLAIEARRWRGSQFVAGAQARFRKVEGHWRTTTE